MTDVEIPRTRRPSGHCGGGGAGLRPPFPSLVFAASTSQPNGWECSIWVSVSPALLRSPECLQGLEVGMRNWRREKEKKSNKEIWSILRFPFSKWLTCTKKAKLRVTLNEFQLLRSRLQKVYDCRNVEAESERMDLYFSSKSDYKKLATGPDNKCVLMPWEGVVCYLQSYPYHSQDNFLWSLIPILFPCAP